ncbi:MAG: ABC transporter [Candidatus Muproteobacteria bacterium RBG_16_60_9]|uniref:ABC transporter n=1 Tax=Candidatus Muproteobacteria bacterium RBG_16_60_9 TaxID=1817755 RepID=A0A1F6UW37_9PROT|nr:MAG: ABC transporter [Candidatus Muproteobacteria bacterium RBG_16_60_9]
MSDSDTVVKAEGLSKIYRLGIKKQASDSLASAMAGFLRSPLRNYRKYRSLYRFDDVSDTTNGSNADDIIWALRDVSFEVRQGEVLGIVGRNGAGKSTLLKILTRITPPTRGRAEIRGRVSSLLEVGTGFHQELTGRENVYLNGTILGMTKAEVDRKFDEIVAFSGVERFLDTPVKRYSSGMSVRLAFAVAAHLEPEILIVDEVLAVGDTEFQKKCINKMQDVSRHGRTVLFVSHNMPAVSALCSRAILMSGGAVAMDGSTHDVVSAYLNSDSGVPSAREWINLPEAPGRSVARLRSVRAVGRDGRAVESVDIGEEVGIEMTIDVLLAGRKLLPHYWFYNEEGAVMFAALNQDPAWYDREFPVGRIVTTAWLPGNLLAAGRIFVTAALITRHPDISQFDEPQVIAFGVRDNMGAGTARGDWAGDMPGVIRPLLKWDTEVAAGVAAGEPARQRS